MTQRLHVGVFEDERTFLAAAHECRRKGLEIVNAFTPYPMHAVDHVMGIKRTRLPWVTLAGGLIGLSLGLWFQYWSSAVDWPVNVGGKPWNSLPAFVPVTFEMTVLLAGIATVVGLLVRCRLYPGRSPSRAIEGVTDNRFALVVRRRADAMHWIPVDEIFTAHGAVQHWEEG